MHGSFPIVLCLNEDDMLSKYAQGLPDPQPLLDNCRRVGDELLNDQVCFLRDVHDLLADVAGVLLLFAPQDTPEKRKVT